MKAAQAKELLKRYREGLCSDEEQKAVESWIEQELLASDWDKSQEDRIRFGALLKGRIDQERLGNEEEPRIRWFPWRRMAAAASIIFCLGIGFYFYQAQSRKQALNNTLYAKQDVNPGGNKATLTLGNGKTIDLSDASSGEIAEQAGIKITKTEDGQLVYDLTSINAATNRPESNINHLAMYNTIATPKGGQYQVRLPDGSKVWLNAASSLKYLASFSAWNERKVELSGEAYFEVAKDKDHPFVVKTENQEVIVLGTHFNINSYKDEPATKTTLLEGSVRVSLLGTTSTASTINTPQKISKGKPAEIILKPGEQATLTGNNIRVSPQNAEDAIAWKDGYFMFNNESLESVMRKISRWYNLDVAFADASIKNQTFYGRMSRFSKVSQVLKSLALTREVKFELKDNTIHVLKN